MATITFTKELLKEFPDIMDTLKERFTSIEPLVAEHHGTKKFEVHGREIPDDDVPLYITFGRDSHSGKLIIFNIEPA